MVARLFAFAVIEIVLLPVSAVGYLLNAVRLLAATRKRISFTAYKPLISRWIYDSTAARPDPAVAPLLFALPGRVRSLGSIKW